MVGGGARQTYLAAVRKNLSIFIQPPSSSSGPSKLVLKAAPGRYSVDIKCPDQLYGELVEIVEENIEITLSYSGEQLRENKILPVY